MIGVLLVCGLSIHPSIGKRLEKIDERIFNFRLLIRNPILFFSAKPDDYDFTDDIPVPEPTIDPIKEQPATIDPNIKESEPTIDTNIEESKDEVIETNAETDFAQEVPTNNTIEEEPDVPTSVNNTEEAIPEYEQENTTLVIENPISEPVIEQTDAEDANIDHETLESNEDEQVSETVDIASCPRISVFLEKMNSHTTSSFIRLLRCFGGSFNDLGIPKRGSEFWETSGRHVNYTFRFQESDVIGVEFLYSGTAVCQSHNYSAVGIPGALQNDVFIFDQPRRLNQVVVTTTNDGDESKSCLYGCNVLVRQQE